MMNGDRKEKRISNIEQGIRNFEGRFAVHRLRFTKLFSFRAFEISLPAIASATAGGFVIICFGVWHLSFDIHLSFGF